MGVRLYNPTTGRFLTVDPVPGGNDNPYIYVTNPNDAFDLNGQWGCWHSWCRRAWHSVHNYTVNVVAVLLMPFTLAPMEAPPNLLGATSSIVAHCRALGIYGDMAIDRYKVRPHLGEQSEYDEGPGSVVYFNPFHTLTRRFGFTGPGWHNAPGA